MSADDIKLPPLPKASKMYDIPGYDEEELKDYARTAIQADRASRAAQAPAADGDALDAEDAKRLDWLDQTNAPFKMGWKVGCAPKGNVSITSVVQLGGNLTSIREAIDAARSTPATEKGAPDA